MKRLILAFAALALSSPALAAPSNPPPLAANSSLVDAADILTPEQEASVEAQTRDIYNRTHHHVVVLTMPTLDGYPVQDYINNAFRYYKIGNAERNDGILLLVSMNNPRRLQIEVGYGLEGVLTDADSMLITEGMKPMMKAGDFAAAINYGVDQIGSQITEEVVTPQALAATTQATASQRAERNDGILTFLFVVLVLGALAGAFYGFIYLPKKRRREEAEAVERQRLRDEEIERRRLDTERWSRQQQELSRQADERRQREERLRGMPSVLPPRKQSTRTTPTPVPSHNRAADNAAAAAAAEAERRRRAERDAEDARRRAREDEDRRRRDREEDDRRQRDSWSSSSWSSSSSSSSSDWGSSSSSSYDSGGSSGGGGGGSDW